MIKQAKYINNQSSRLNYPEIERSRIEVRRATVPSSADEERMAMESSRVSLIRHSINHVDEAAHTNTYSCYQESSENFDPPCFINSSMEKSQPKKVPVTKKFSICNKFKFNTPSNSPKNSQTNINCKRTFHCKCSNCKKVSCPGRRSRNMLKDNIMTFCDHGTMTPTLADVNCGSTPVPSRYDCRINSSTAVRDTDDDMSVNDRCRPLSPILKRSNRNGCIPKQLSFSKHPDNFVDEDVENQSCKLSRSGSTRSFWRFNRKNSEGNINQGSTRRRNIYNEGISDNIVKDFPSYMKDISQNALRCPRTPLRTKPSIINWDAYGYIPYAHKYNSRYHNHCLEGAPKQYVLSNNDGRDYTQPWSTFGKKTSKAFDRKLSPICRAPCNQHPKKVVPSHMNMEHLFNDDYHTKYDRR